MNQPWVYMCPPSWNTHPSGSSQCTSPERPVSCIEPGLAIYFTYDNIHISMLFSQIIPPSLSPTESKRLFYTSVSLSLSRIQDYCYHFSKFHIYALVYCIDREAWHAVIHGVEKSWTRLSDWIELNWYCIDSDSNNTWHVELEVRWRVRWSI